MSHDSALRELERAAPGDPAAEERWIVARLRAGTLSEDRLHVMRLLGHEGASRATGKPMAPYQHLPATALFVVSVYLRDRAAADAATFPIGAPPIGPWPAAAVTYAVELCALAQGRWHRTNSVMASGPSPSGGMRVRIDAHSSRTTRCHDSVCDGAIRCQRAARQWLEGSTSVQPALFALSTMAGAPVGDSPAVGPLWAWLPARIACGLSVENLPSLHGVCMDLGVQPQAMLDAVRVPLIAWCLA